jgi:hypothetical protein
VAKFWVGNRLFVLVQHGRLSRIGFCKNVGLASSVSFFLSFGWLEVDPAKKFTNWARKSTILAYKHAISFFNLAIASSLMQ